MPSWLCIIGRLRIHLFARALSAVMVACLSKGNLGGPGGCDARPFHQSLGVFALLSSLEIQLQWGRTHKGGRHSWHEGKMGTHLTVAPPVLVMDKALCTSNHYVAPLHISCRWPLQCRSVHIDAVRCESSQRWRNMHGVQNLSGEMRVLNTLICGLSDARCTTPLANAMPQCLV